MVWRGIWEQETLQRTFWNYVRIFKHKDIRCHYCRHRNVVLRVVRRCPRGRESWSWWIMSWTCTRNSVITTTAIRLAIVTAPRVNWLSISLCRKCSELFTTQGESHRSECIDPCMSCSQSLISCARLYVSFWYFPLGSGSLYNSKNLSTCRNRQTPTSIRTLTLFEKPRNKWN